MIAVQDLADELLLTNVSIRHHCRRQSIDTQRRLPEGQLTGHMRAFVVDEDAARIRDHYAARLADRTG